MGIHPIELAVQRKLTAAFIAADSLTLTLLRATQTADGEGGVVTGDPAPLAPQTMRLIPMRDGAEGRFTADGKMVVPEYMLMGTHAANMERGDEFYLEGKRYELLFVQQNKQYEKKAEVAYRG
jgi:hypothetical protein